MSLETQRKARFIALVLSASVVLPVLLVAGCGGDGEASGLRLDLDKRHPERLVRFYLGGYAGAEGQDPFEAGLVRAEGGRLYLDPEALAEPQRAALEAANDGDGVIDWDEFAAFVEATYAQARQIPPTLDALRAEAPYAADSAWFTVEVDGVMTSARRRVFVPMEALRSALAGYHENGERLVYPTGTVIVGEHHLGGQLAETTAMRRRADGTWDFFVYGSDGALAPATDTPPRALRAPTQCVGCHVGSRAFEPEQSFPSEAPPGPFGPRAVHVGPALRDAEVVAFFDEHRKRSDTVLGLYGTLFVSKLLADRDAGRLAPEDAALLDALGVMGEG